MTQVGPLRDIESTRKPSAVDRKHEAQCRSVNALAACRHDRASEVLDEWDCVDELVDEESWSQELVV